MSPSRIINARWDYYANFYALKMGIAIAFGATAILVYICVQGKLGEWKRLNVFKVIEFSENIYWTHWGPVTHVSVSKVTIIGPDNGLSPGRRQAIIWTNAGILLIRILGTNFSEILIYIHPFKKMSSAKWWQYCFGLNVFKNRLQWILWLLGWFRCYLVQLYWQTGGLVQERRTPVY